MTETVLLWFAKVLIYIFAGIFISKVFNKVTIGDNETEENSIERESFAVVSGMFWPLTIFIFIVYQIFKYPVKAFIKSADIIINFIFRK